MLICVFGLTITSSWGNGHATLWRGLVRALADRGCHVIFYERDAPYYSASRDMTEMPGATIVLYRDWDEIAERARRDVSTADATMVTSYCPDGIAATALTTSAGRATSVFYDLDTPVSIDALRSHSTLPWIGPRGLRDFDLVLSFTGGAALSALETQLGARKTAPLYGHVDPNGHRPVAPQLRYASDLSYLGTYAPDRQSRLERLFVEPARQRPSARFMIGGAQYPDDFPWTRNIYFVRHLPPEEHPAFFSSSRMTLNVTRKPMAEMGWCPSGRLFEAAACCVPIITDDWEGLGSFFAPDEEILVARDPVDVLAALDTTDDELHAMAKRAYERTMACHTSARRAAELLDLFQHTRSPATTPVAS